MAENIVVYTVRVNTQDGKIKIDGLTKGFVQAESAAKKLVSTTNTLDKSVQDFNSAAGLAGATVNEFGRLVSDLPYGITAVTNNISQLGSLFSVLVSKASQINNGLGTLKNTVALLKKELLGPLGILLLFQSAISALDFWAQNAKKANKSTDDLNESIGKSAIELKIAKEIINDSSESLEKKQSIVDQVNKKYKDFTIVLDENGIATEESTNKINAQIVALEKLAKSQSIVNEVQKIYGEIAILNAKTGADVATGLDTFLTGWETFGEAILFFSSFGFAGEQVDYYGKKIEERGQFTKKKILDENKKIVKDLLTQLEVLFSEGNKKPTIKKLEDLNSLLIKSQLNYLQSVNELTEETQLQNLNGITGLRLEELDIQKKSALDKAKEQKRSNSELLLIQEAYENKRIALINDSNEKALSIRKSFNKELKTEAETYADDKHLDAMLETLLPAKEQVEKRAKETTDGLAAYQKKREEIENNGNSAVAKLREEDKLAAVYAFQDVSNAVFGVMDASFQREIDLEKDKTNQVNNELRERLANENLSADERKKIQQKIAVNDEELRKKQDAIERKKFKMNKAASIANATINTYLAATAALKDPALSTFQRIASMVSIIGSGLAQVAVIAKQKFVSSQSSIGAGASASSGGGAQVQAPDFNVVGQSSSNQIASVIQSQMQKPIRTYVVSKDVSTAQEMDRNIVKTASLG